MQIRANPTLSFKDAYKITFKHKDNFSGRARRSEFWNYCLFFFIQFIIFYILLLIFLFKVNKKQESFFYSLLSMVMFFFSFLEFFFIFLLISISIRRLHDTGKSGYCLLLMLIPFGAFIILFFFLQDSTKGKNKYGPSPKYYECQENPLMDIDYPGQNIMLQNIPPQMNNNNNNQIFLANPSINIPQGQLSISIPINRSNDYMINQSNMKLIPQLVVNEDYEPGILQENFDNNNK